MPCLVYEMRIGAYGIDLHAHGLELVIILSHVHQFRRAYKSKIGRIEKETQLYTLLYQRFCIIKVLSQKLPPPKIE